MSNQPIEIYYGNLALDLGTATIPRMLARFWPFLRHGEERLDDWEYAVLLQVLILRDEQDFELRAENLPLRSSLRSIERLKSKLRRMGLVFTQRVYYPPRPGKPPAMRSQRWDMRSLFYNLELVARQWMAENGCLADEWARKGRKGKKPVYAFPADFHHQIVLPPDIALDLARGEFFPSPEEWKNAAVALLGTVHLPTGLKTAGRQPTDHATVGRQGSPTDLETAGRQPTDHKTVGHLIDSDLRGGGEENNSPQNAVDLQVNQILTEFASRCADPNYRPSSAEQHAARALLEEGFLLEAEILPGIQKAFARAKTPPRSFMYCVRVIRQNKVEISIDNDYAKQPTVPEPTPELVVEPDLAAAVYILTSAGQTVNNSTLARLRLMADRVDQAAHAQGATGAIWLADALRTGLGVARDGSLANYADSVLESWITHGRQITAPKERRQPKRGKTVANEPAGSTHWPSDSD